PVTGLAGKLALTLHARAGIDHPPAAARLAAMRLRVGLQLSRRSVAQELAHGREAFRRRRGRHDLTGRQRVTERTGEQHRHVLAHDLLNSRAVPGRLAVELVERLLHLFLRERLRLRRRSLLLPRLRLSLAALCRLLLLGRL